MGEQPLLWFVPVLNSLGNGLAFPVSEDVRGVLRGMGRGGGGLGGVVEEEEEEEDEDERVYRRDGEGRWMMHD